MKKLGIALSLLLTIGFIPAYAEEAEPQVSDPAAETAVEMNDQAAVETMDNAAAEETVVQAEEKVEKKAETKAAVNFGDYKSSTLATKAWGALAAGDVESVLAYTNKCIELYGEQARKMQADLKDYVTGSNDDVFKKWALNDVATSYYIQGEAYRKAKMKDEAKEAYNKVINEYTFGQAWDTKGWFWKPSEAAKEKLAAVESGVDIDYGDYTSSTLATKAWGALNAKDYPLVIALVKKNIELYAAKAKEMQASLKEYAWESKEKTMSYWALNDVGTSLFILGEAYRASGNKEEAAKAYKQLIDEYFYAQCWDPNGWFWKPAEAAQQKLGELDNV